jgi:hypothetical protein
MATTVQIKPVNLNVVEIPIIGTAPYCQHAFSAKARGMMLAAQTDPTKKSKGRKAKPPRDVDDEFHGATHRSEEGWIGIPASSFRCASISACRLVGFKMTLAKLSIFIQADGLDAADGQPLVKLIADAPERSEMAVRLESGVASVAIRPLWREWGAMLRVRFDADQFSVDDVFNLVDRAGQQVGIGEGRPDSKNSAGLGWGTFRVDYSAMGRKES